MKLLTAGGREEEVVVEDPRGEERPELPEVNGAGGVLGPTDGAEEDDDEEEEEDERPRCCRNGEEHSRWLLHPEREEEEEEMGWVWFWTELGCCTSTALPFSFLA